MKKIIKRFVIFNFLLSFMISAASAANCATGAGSEGFYLGMQVGKTAYNEQQILVPTGTGLFTNADPKNNGIGARLFFGYTLNAFFGSEAGFIYFSPLTYNTEIDTVCGTPRREHYAFDVLLKGMLPLASFKLFVKGGLAVLGTTTRNIGFPTKFDELCGERATSTNVHPEFGIGASYNLTPNWIFDLTLNRILKGGGIADIDFVAIGVTYHFVDLYCGQFLC